MLIEPLIESETDYAALGMNFELISCKRYFHVHLFAGKLNK